MFPSLPTMSGIAHAGALGQRLHVRRVDVEPNKGFGQVWRMVEDPVALVWAWNRESNPADLAPGEAIGLQVLVNRIDPAGDGNVRTVL